MILSALLALAAATQSPRPAEIAVSGGHLTTAAGSPLYTYDNDTMVGMSHCLGDCARAYPPLLAGPGARASGPWTLVERDGGLRQWAYRDKPLYTTTVPEADAPKDRPWRLATSQEASVHAAPATAPGSSRFACGGDRGMVISFPSGGRTPVALVDVGDGPAALPLQPFAGGQPQITWSDGRHTLTWSTGVKLSWTGEGEHLACGRQEHHH